MRNCTRRHPEEAEQLLPLLRNSENFSTCLLTYAASVTRKLLHFGSLKFFSIPTLSGNWEAPIWLRIELGLLAGRLYFDYREYGALLQYIGTTHLETSRADNEDEDEETESLDLACSETASHLGQKSQESHKQLQAFAHKPLAFLQEWLAFRRKGQDFAQTPMSFICQGKSIAESHPFFAKSQDEIKKNRAVHVNVPRNVDTSAEEADEGDHGFDENMFGVHDGPDEIDAFDDAQLDDEEVDEASGSGVERSSESS